MRQGLGPPSFFAHWSKPTVVHCVPDIKPMSRSDLLPGRALDRQGKDSLLRFPCKALSSRDGRLRPILAPGPSCRPSLFLFARRWRPAISGSESTSARQVVPGGYLIGQETHHPLPVPVPQDSVGEPPILACISFSLSLYL